MDWGPCCGGVSGVMRITEQGPRDIGRQREDVPGEVTFDL